MVRGEGHMENNQRQRESYVILMVYPSAEWDKNSIECATMISRADKNLEWPSGQPL